MKWLIFGELARRLAEIRTACSPIRHTKDVLTLSLLGAVGEPQLAAKFPPAARSLPTVGWGRKSEG